MHLLGICTVVCTYGGLYLALADQRHRPVFHFRATNRSVSALLMPARAWKKKKQMMAVGVQKVPCTYEACSMLLPDARAAYGKDVSTKSVCFSFKLLLQDILPPS